MSSNSNKTPPILRLNHMMTEQNSLTYGLTLQNFTKKHQGPALLFTFKN